MTSASELFYTRRSRVGRADALDLGLDPSPQRNSHHHHHYKCSSNRRCRHQSDHNHAPDGYDPRAGGPSHFSHPPRRHASQSELELFSLSLGGTRPGPGNSSSTETLSRCTNQPGVSQSDRLPGSVILARERLVQRLRGLPTSANRQSGSRSSRSIAGSEHTSNDLQLITTDQFMAEFPRLLTARVRYITSLISQREQRPSLQQQREKKPPGLTDEALNSLKVELFSCQGDVIEGAAPQLSCDCSICLESFREGDELVCLPCEHRFHLACLYPWLQTCGDCPYCRGTIVPAETNSGKMKASCPIVL